jgi:hypothetical protein
MRDDDTPVYRCWCCAGTGWSRGMRCPECGWRHVESERAREDAADAAAGFREEELW